MSKKINSKKIGLIIYARMSSKRLPGKVLKKFYKNQNTIEIILANLNKINFKKNVIVATTSCSLDKKIVNFCRNKKVRFFTGSNKNVFLRTQECIKKFNIKYLVRICADRPLFDVNLMVNMIKLILKNDYDIITNVYPRTYPKGLTCEVAKSKIFTQINQKILTQNQKEHIFNYFYKSKKYRILNLEKRFKKTFLKKNFCIDHLKDISRVQNILKILDKKNLKINTHNISKI
tara:strand:- start:26633 stop:27328 length:696 start_codon:yes stop_codon:yes gene_type:complete